MSTVPLPTAHLPDADAADEQQVLTFHVGAMRFAAPAEAVAEVFRRTKVTRVPLGPPGLLGLMNLRGTVVPVVSLAKLLGQDEAPVTAQSRILLLHRSEPIGVAVDGVSALAMVKMPEPRRDGPKGPSQLLVFDEGALRVLRLNELIERDFAGLARRGSQPSLAVVSAPQERPAEKELLLLTFELAGQHHALALDEVAELLPVPSKLTMVPQSDAAILGVISLRERLLPIASLGFLLGLGATPTDQQGARIVVAQIGGTRVGFLVDRVNAILRTSPAFVDPVPAVLNRGPGEAHVQSICRLPGNGGLVSILSAAHLFKDDTIMQILSDAGDTEAEISGQVKMGTLEQILVFQLGEEDYGLPVGAVEEVLNLPEGLTRVPRAPAFVEGVMNHRGKVLTVVDQRRRFGVESDTAGKRRRVIVTKLNEMLVGFVVDTVSEIRSLSTHQIKSAPDLTAADGNPLFDRIATLDAEDRMILLIEPRELLNRAERDLLKAFNTAEEGSVIS